MGTRLGARSERDGVVGARRRHKRARSAPTRSVAERSEGLGRGESRSSRSLSGMRHALHPIGSSGVVIALRQPRA